MHSFPPLVPQEKSEVIAQLELDLERLFAKAQQAREDAFHEALASLQEQLIPAVEALHYALQEIKDAIEQEKSADREQEAVA